MVDVLICRCAADSLQSSRLDEARETKTLSAFGAIHEDVKLGMHCLNKSEQLRRSVARQVLVIRHPFSAEP